MTTLVRPLLVAFPCIALAHVAAAQPPMDLSPAEMIKRADTNGDGKVSRDEFIKARTARLEEKFARMDTDGDGQLDGQEAEAATEQIRAMLAGGRGGFRRPDGPRPPRPDGERPQRPGSGAVGEQGFDRLDRDGDGKLSREEFADGMARMREHMQRGGQGPGGPDRTGRGPTEGFRQPPQQD